MRKFAICGAVMAVSISALTAFPAQAAGKVVMINGGNLKNWGCNGGNIPMQGILIPGGTGQNQMGGNQDVILPPMDQEGNQDDYAAQVIDLVNEERAKAGLKPLTPMEDLSKAARLRAGETAVNFSHTRPDGTSFSTILAQNQISYRGAGENIAYGQKAPEQVMRDWMNSQGHRANILNSQYTSIGVGYYESADKTPYWVQLFTY
ncbi:MAG: CAP domain-containing protein [Lachnospiraceae bacterium]